MIPVNASLWSEMSSDEIAWGKTEAMRASGGSVRRGKLSS